MDISRDILIRTQARDLLHRHWKSCTKGSAWSVPSFQEILLYAPEGIAASLRLKVSVVHEIPDTELLSGGRSPVEIIGILDRDKKTIVVAGKHGFERRRFTLAHELGHFQLHPVMTMHREISIDGSDNLSALSKEEREANLFAAELLMPSRWVRHEFLDRFEGVLGGRESIAPLYYWLSQSRPGIDRDRFAADRAYRSIQVAQARGCYGKTFLPLCAYFHVSANAMSRQLTDLGLVK